METTTRDKVLGFLALIVVGICWWTAANRPFDADCKRTEAALRRAIGEAEATNSSLQNSGLAAQIARAKVVLNECTLNAMSSCFDALFFEPKMNNSLIALQKAVNGAHTNPPSVPYNGGNGGNSGRRGGRPIGGADPDDPFAPTHPH